MSVLELRAGVAGDLPALVEIYNHYIRTTAITFDLEPYTIETRRPWFGKFAPAGRYRRLYAALFEALCEEDVHRAYAGITLPNPASAALHERALIS